MLIQQGLVARLQLRNGPAMGHWCQYRPSATVSVGKRLEKAQVPSWDVGKEPREVRGAQPIALYSPDMRMRSPG